ncbi:LamB/YcsF family protein [Orrella marina]|uniref:5-oxoprolinase subunit A n=1 Tax=Orrella marina TaxID=2163011 RepID=A0A2R4XL17_9BURK|nr:5-oxoprolinase subunit PxpA [Orrella marina]AWB34496.1 LamB/YcsF family protein [Orrella marina]
MNLKLDLNCDMGESFGTWKMGHDRAIMPYVSSANIACGFHAGDPATMRETVACAIAHGVAIGAHPGLPDLQGFGRRFMQITEQEAYDMAVVQIGALAGVAASQGAKLNHVKAHGMLYNMAVKNQALARGLARAVHDVDPSLVFFGLAGTIMIDEAKALGLRTASEVFGDRSYQSDGSLTPRNLPGAMITDVSLSIEQVLRMVKEKIFIAQDGTQVPVQADTLCLHGDQPDAVSFAQAIRNALKEANIEVGAL